MNKDEKYRLSHPDRVKEAARATYYKHHELNLQKKRDRYQREKEKISEDGKKDRKLCPHCNIEFRGNYLKKHILIRHSPDSPEDLVSEVAS